jgi:hypothetical protein
MELGVGMFGDNHYDQNGKPLPAGERLRELIEEIKLMDEVGLDFFGIGESALENITVLTMQSLCLKLFWPLQLQLRKKLNLGVQSQC